MLEGVGHQFVDDQSARNRSIEIHPDFRRDHLQSNRVLRVEKCVQMRDQFLQIAAKIDLTEALRPIKHLVDQRHGSDAVAQFHQQGSRRCLRYRLALQLQHVDDGGEVVLDPMVDFAQQHLFFC